MSLLLLLCISITFEYIILISSYIGFETNDQ